MWSTGSGPGLAADRGGSRHIPDPSRSRAYLTAAPPPVSTRWSPESSEICRVMKYWWTDSHMMILPWGIFFVARSPMQWFIYVLQAADVFMSCNSSCCSWKPSKICQVMMLNWCLVVHPLKQISWSNHRSNGFSDLQRSVGSPVTYMWGHDVQTDGLMVIGLPWTIFLIRSLI